MVQLVVPVFVMRKPLAIVPTATELRSNLMRRCDDSHAVSAAEVLVVVVDDVEEDVVEATVVVTDVEETGAEVVVFGELEEEQPPSTAPTARQTPATRARRARI